MVFDFEEWEEIVSAELFDDGQMDINYIDTKDNTTGCYKPYFVDDEMKEKLDFILNGVQLSRTE